MNAGKYLWQNPEMEKNAETTAKKSKGLLTFLKVNWYMRPIMEGKI